MSGTWSYYPRKQYLSEQDVVDIIHGDWSVTWHAPGIWSFVKHNWNIAFGYKALMWYSARCTKCGEEQEYSNYNTCGASILYLSCQNHRCPESPLFRKYLLGEI